MYLNPYCIAVSGYRPSNHPGHHNLYRGQCTDYSEQCYRSAGRAKQQRGGHDVNEFHSDQVNVQNRVAKAQGNLPAEVTQVGVITQKRQSSMLLGFSFYSSDDKYDNEFLENYMNINIIPEIKRIQGVGDAMMMGTD